MVGYSGTPLPRKLGIRDDQVVFWTGCPPTSTWATSAANVVRRLADR
ncbi:MAG: hypothetical protein ACR2JD_00690 [Nocardioides sp.]